MYRYNNGVFLDVGKTSTSFIIRVLDNLVEEPTKEKLRHRGVKAMSPHYFYFTNIRNPYKYYVSHLSYSKSHQGQILKYLMAKQNGGKGRWQKTTLKEYIDMIMVQRKTLPNNNHYNALGDAMSNMPDTMGMLTCHYILYLDADFLMKKRTEAEVEDWFERYYFSASNNYIALNGDNLNQELYQMCELKQDELGLKSNWKELWDNVTQPDKKEDKCLIDDYMSHYKDCLSSIDIIRQQERVLIDHYAFTI